MLPWYYAVTHVQTMQFVFLRRVTDGVAESGPGQAFEIKLLMQKMRVWNSPDWNGPSKQANIRRTNVTQPWCVVIDVEENADVQSLTEESLLKLMNSYGTVGDSAVAHLSMLNVGAGKPQSRKYSGKIPLCMSS